MIICKNENKDFTEQCAFIWFHESGHGELEVDSRIHNLVWGQNSVHSLTEPEWRNRALNEFSTTYFRFQIAISTEEKQRIIQEMGRLGIQTCSGNVAAVLRKVTGMSLPWFDSMFPSKLAKHLYQISKAPNSRVCKIEYIGVLDSVSKLNKVWNKSISESAISEYKTAGSVAAILSAFVLLILIVSMECVRDS